MWTQHAQGKQMQYDIFSNAPAIYHFTPYHTPLFNIEWTHIYSYDKQLFILYMINGHLGWCKSKPTRLFLSKPIII